MREFCSECGTKYPELVWPRQCSKCGALSWLNPCPVIVMLHPVTDGDRVGALIAKRAIDPQKGKWSLISGFMNPGETAEEACIREFREETGLGMHKPDLKYWFSAPNERMEIMLFFSFLKPMSGNSFLGLELCQENEAFGVAWESRNLAFPTHEEFLKLWLSTLI